MRVDPQQLVGAARSLAGSAEDFGAQLDALQATLTTGNPWGQDEAGSLFGTAYVQVLSHALEALGSHVGQLVQAAEGLGTWAEQVWQAEQANVGQIDQAASGLFGG